MKNFISLIIVLLLVFSFSACGTAKPEETPFLPSESESSADESSENVDFTENNKSGENKTIAPKEDNSITKLTAESEKVKEAVSYVEAIASSLFSENLDNDSFVVSWKIKSIEFDTERTDFEVNHFSNEADIEYLSENIVSIVIKTEIIVTEEYYEGHGGFGEGQVWHEGEIGPEFIDCFVLEYGNIIERNLDSVYGKYAEGFETNWRVINYGDY